MIVGPAPTCSVAFSPGVRAARENDRVAEKDQCRTPVSENPDSRRGASSLRIFIHYRCILSSVPRIEEAAERLYQPDPLILFRMLHTGFREGPYSR
jgi:hypothetical protein